MYKYLLLIGVLNTPGAYAVAVSPDKSSTETLIENELLLESQPNKFTEVDVLKATDESVVDLICDEDNCTVIIED